MSWQRAKWGKFSSNIIRVGEKTAAIYAHELVVVSKALKIYFAQTHHMRPIYIPNGPGAYAETEPNSKFLKSLGLTPGKYLLFVGRLVPEKRIDFLIQAFQILKETGWKLAIAGGDSDTTAYLTELHKLAQGNPDIVFTGELKGSRLAEIVKEAGFLVSSSNLEGLPLTMLEAMREGVPIVASDIAPHQQLLGSDRGLLFDSVSILACARAIEQAMLNPKQLAVMAEKAQVHVKANYNWSMITDANLAVYAQNFGVVESSIAESKNIDSIQLLSNNL